MNPFRPPAIIRSVAASAAKQAGLVLDRSQFSKTVSLAAATVAEKRMIGKWRSVLSGTREILAVERLQAVRPHPDGALAASGVKCLLLDPRVQAAVPETWSPDLKSAIESRELGLVPFELALTYDYWLYGMRSKQIILAKMEKKEQHV